MKLLPHNARVTLAAVFLTICIGGNILFKLRPARESSPAATRASPALPPNPLAQGAGDRPQLSSFPQLQDVDALRVTKRNGGDLGLKAIYQLLSNGVLVKDREALSGRWAFAPDSYGEIEAFGTVYQFQLFKGPLLYLVDSKEAAGFIQRPVDIP